LWKEKTQFVRKSLCNNKNLTAGKGWVLISLLGKKAGGLNTFYIYRTTDFCPNKGGDPIESS